MRGERRGIGVELPGIIFALGTLVGVVGHGTAVEAQEELFIANAGANSVTVYARTASGNTIPLRTLQGGATGLNNPLFLAVTIPSPTATVALNGSAFFTGKTIIYGATLTPGSTPTLADIYLGALLPDGVTFLSLVELSSRVISFPSRSAPPRSPSWRMWRPGPSESHSRIGLSALSP